MHFILVRYIKVNLENMAPVKTFDEDLSLAKAILKRDGEVTTEFLYKKCYPLMKSIFNRYYTDSSNVYDFINEIYLLILTPGKTTGRCQLENYRGESSLTTWLKTVCLFYCYKRYKQKSRIPMVDIVMPDAEENDDNGDRLLDNNYSTTMDMKVIDRADVDKILDMMPNERYRMIIRLHYLEGRTLEETAKELNMSMTNFYNKHKLAKDQFVNMLNMEAAK